MIDQPFRKILPNYTQLLVSGYRKLGITPNQISIASFFISLFATFLILRGHFLGSLIAWWAGRLLDGTDGIYARATGQASAFGAYLDILCDMASYSSMIIGFFFAFPDQRIGWVVVLFLYVLCITSALAYGSLEEKSKNPPKDNRGLRLASGLAEGGETGIAYSVFLLAPSLISYSLSLWIIILLLTVVSRSIMAHRLIQQ